VAWTSKKSVPNYPTAQNEETAAAWPGATAGVRAAAVLQRPLRPGRLRSDPPAKSGCRLRRLHGRRHHTWHNEATS